VPDRTPSRQYILGGSATRSTSAALTQTVNKATTTAALVSSLNPSTHGKAVTFTATITPASGALVSGSVTFRDGTATLGTGALNTSTHKAMFMTTALGAGSHSITAVYAGSAEHRGSTSRALKETVN
jgi:Bacterial Ig-like domain (group 3)